MRFTATATFLVLLAPDVSSQCCLGAQNTEARSANGRFVVRATSLTGTGPRHHGPYRFRFASERVDGDGKARPLAAFDATFDTRAHFSMGIIVSPTGNGFLLRAPGRQEISLWSTGGNELRTAKIPVGAHLATRQVSHDGLFLDVELIEDIERRRRSTCRSRIFVPLGTFVGPETRREPGGEWQDVPADSRRLRGDDEAAAWLGRMLQWTPDQGRRDRDAVNTALARLREHPGGEARRMLLDLGLSARTTIRAALDEPTAPAARSELAKALETLDDEITRRLAGHDAPQRDVELLAALLAHPGKALAAAARARLLRILPKDAEPTRKWLADHGAALTWDAAHGRYR